MKGCLAGKVVVWWLLLAAQWMSSPEQALAQATLAPLPQSQEAKALIAEFRLEEGKAPVREFPRWRTPKKIVLAGNYSPAQLAELRKVAPVVEFLLARDRAAQLTAVADADAFMGTCNDADVVAAGKELRWVQQGTAGVENCISNPAFRDGRVLLTNMRHADAPIIAEHAVALMFALNRALPSFVRAQDKANWTRGAPIPLRHVRGKTMLVVGLGGIGTEVAERARALGMRIIATRNTGREGPSFVSYVGLPDEMLQLAREADVVVNATPLTPQTTGMFDAKFFAAMQPDAIFINVSRGKSVVTDDLIAALKSGRIAGAGLDVTEPEPLPPDHPLWSAPNVLITPHIAPRSSLKGDNQWVILKENIRRYTAGEKLLSVVDPKLGY